MRCSTNFIICTDLLNLLNKCALHIDTLDISSCMIFLLYLLYIHIHTYTYIHTTNFINNRPFLIFLDRKYSYF